MDTGRKLNVHKAFRRCLGRLLNVLCTLNLRPVHRGICFEHLNIMKTMTISDHNSGHRNISVMKGSSSERLYYAKYFTYSSSHLVVALFLLLLEISSNYLQFILKKLRLSLWVILHSKIFPQRNLRV